MQTLYFSFPLALWVTAGTGTRWGERQAPSGLCDTVDLSVTSFWYVTRVALKDYHHSNATDSLFKTKKRATVGWRLFAACLMTRLVGESFQLPTTDLGPALSEEGSGQAISQSLVHLLEPCIWNSETALYTATSQRGSTKRFISLAHHACHKPAQAALQYPLTIKYLWADVWPMLGDRLTRVLDCVKSRGIRWNQSRIWITILLDILHI